jgi:hypothetical protein
MEAGKAVASLFQPALATLMTGWNYSDMRETLIRQREPNVVAHVPQNVWYRPRPSGAGSAKAANSG